MESICYDIPDATIRSPSYLGTTPAWPIPFFFFTCHSWRLFVVLISLINLLRIVVLVVHNNLSVPCQSPFSHAMLHTHSPCQPMDALLRMSYTHTRPHQHYRRCFSRPWSYQEEFSNGWNECGASVFPWCIWPIKDAYYTTCWWWISPRICNYRTVPAVRPRLFPSLFWTKASPSLVQHLINSTKHGIIY